MAHWGHTGPAVFVALIVLAKTYMHTGNTMTDWRNRGVSAMTNERERAAMLSESELDWGEEELQTTNEVWIWNSCGVSPGPCPFWQTSR